MLLFLANSGKNYDIFLNFQASICRCSSSFLRAFRINPFIIWVKNTPMAGAQIFWRSYAPFGRPKSTLSAIFRLFWCSKIAILRESQKVLSKVVANRHKICAPANRYISPQISQGFILACLRKELEHLQIDEKRFKNSWNSLPELKANMA